MKKHNTEIICDQDTLHARVTTDRQVLRSLCLLLSYEIMDWKLVLDIDKTLPDFVHETNGTRQTIFNATCEFNAKRRWILKHGCFTSYLTPYMMKNFILIDNTYWISAHTRKRERQRVIHELVYTLAPRKQHAQKIKFVPEVSWTRAELEINYDARWNNDN